MAVSISGEGAISGSSSYSFDSNVSIAGTLTYEDVTSVDSIGIITAQSGIHVTGGVQVGTGATITGSTNIITASTNGGERLRITSDGSVGIGTDPSAGYNAFTNGLVVKRGGANEGITIDCSNQGGIFFSNGYDGGEFKGQLIYYHTPGDHYMAMLVNGSQRLRITHAGITSVTGSLAVNGNNYPTVGQLSNRNLIINGSMQVAQRGTSFTSVNATAFHMDRFQLYYQNSSAAFTVTQSTDTPNGFGNSLKIFVTTADSSIASNEEIKLFHKIEGQDLQAVAKGTSVAKQLTLSFYVKATKTGTYIVELFDRDNSRDVSASYTVSDTNWNRYTLTFPADTTGAFDDDNASSLEISWWLVAGSAVQTDALNTTWRSSQDAGSATGQVNFTDNEDNGWYITGVQLEVGEKATPFEHRSFGDELARCQRYYQRITAQTANARMAIGGNGSVSQCFPTAYLPTTMRAQPSVSHSAVSDFTNEGIAGGGTQTVSSISFNAASSHAVTIQSVASGGSGSATGAQVLSNNTNAHLAFHAEL